MGDRNDVGEVYAGSYRRLVVQLYAVTGDLQEAQEAVQEAFARAVASAGRFGRLDNPESWLRQVAVNLARTRYRRRRTLEALLPRLHADPVVAAPSAEHVALMEAMRRLPAKQRYAVGLHYLADLPLDEVAQTLNVSVGTVKSRLARGRSALSALLAVPTDDPDASPRPTKGAHR